MLHSISYWCFDIKKVALAGSLWEQSNTMWFLKYRMMILRSQLKIEKQKFYVLKMVIVAHLHIFFFVHAANDIMEWLQWSRLHLLQKEYLLITSLFYIQLFLVQKSFYPNKSNHCFYQNWKISFQFRKLGSDKSPK